MKNKIKEWFIAFVAVKLVKAIIKNADVSTYAIVGADAVDKYLDKYLGEKPSEVVQTDISVWLNETVDAFVTELKNN